jgi:hypothetical protein
VISFSAASDETWATMASTCLALRAVANDPGLPRDLHSAGVELASACGCCTDASLVVFSVSLKRSGEERREQACARRMKCAKGWTETSPSLLRQVGSFEEIHAAIHVA